MNIYIYNYIYVYLYIEISHLSLWSPFEGMMFQMDPTEKHPQAPNMDINRGVLIQKL